MPHTARSLWEGLAIADASPWCDKKCQHRIYWLLDCLWRHALFAFYLLIGVPLIIVYWPVGLAFFALAPIPYIVWHVRHNGWHH